MRRLTVVSARKLFRPGEEGRITIDRERVGVSISALHGAAMHLFAVGVTALLVLRRPDHLWGNIGVALVIVLTAVAIADQLIPFLLVARHDEAGGASLSSGCRWCEGWFTWLCRSLSPFSFPPP